jgi:hypothetical protein
MRSWARSAGLAFDPVWFFDEARVARLLRVDDSEGLFAVVPLRWQPSPDPTTPAGPERRRDPAPSEGPVRVRHRDVERSRRVGTFAMVERMQRATRQDTPDRPAPGALAAAAPAPPATGATAPVVLPPPSVGGSLRQALRRRRSSFGRFDARTPLPLPALATSLASAGAAAGDTVGSAGLVGIYVFVNHVEGLPPATYRYDDGRLWLVRPGPPGSFLQRSYFLANYNLEQAAAVVVPTMRTRAVLDAVGDRGYRWVNATIGAVAQNVYLAGAALGIGCGVALGFDNVSYVEHLALPEGESPLLLMMLGAERPGSADFRYEIT